MDVERKIGIGPDNLNTTWTNSIYDLFDQD